MNPSLILALVLIFVIVLCAGLFSLHFFSTEARLERRRRKSHSRVIAKQKRPMVSLSVKTKKDGKK
jgi:hypothetical protein